MYKSSGGMKRDRLGDSSSPPPPSSMSKRSRSSGGGGGRYGGGLPLNDDSSDDGASPPPSLDNRSGGGGGRSSERHHPRGSSTGGGAGGGAGARSSSRNLSPRSRNYGQDDSYSSSSRSYKEGRGGGGGTGGGHPYQYKVLCISNLHSKASDEVIRDTLYREFKRFGDISVKVVHEPDERLAFVYFRSAEDAREAKHSKSRIIIYDKPVVVEAAYESTTTPASSNNLGGGGGGTGGGGGGSYGGGRSSSHHTSSPPPPHLAKSHSSSHHSSSHHDYDSKMYRRSPVYDSSVRGGRDDHHNTSSRYDSRYERSGGMAPPPGPPPPMHYNREYRGGGRDNMHHEYNRGPPPPGGGPMGGGGSHYSRYPPGGNGMGGGPRHHHHNQHHSMAPPPHHHPGMEPPPPHHGMGPPMGGGPPGAPSRYENKKDKFPNYLHHVSPEDDPLATRTLFAGNLEVNITDEELRRIFGRYGTVEDIDIKRPPPGTGNAYAFVRYVNLDMASRAKSELSGQYIGKFQCKIGYGKVNPTTKIWIGGLGPWTNMAMLEREFDRFGSIKKIEWVKGDMYAYITYETIDAAQAAVKDMRGYPLGGNDKRLRTDFADASSPPITSFSGGSGGGTPYAGKSREYPVEGGAPVGDPGAGGDFAFNNSQNFRNPRSGSFNRNSREDLREDADGVASQPAAGRSGGGPGSTHSGGTDLGTTSPGGSDSESAPGERQRNGAGGLLSAAKSIQEISKRGTVGWQGSLILKNSSFPSKLYMMEGDLEGVDVLMKDEEGKCQLRITQRLRLDQSKLDDVMKRIQGAIAHGVFLAMPGAGSTGNPIASSPGESGDGGPVQSRPLRNLVSYLKQKEAAGVISLVNAKDITTTGVLYAFPPCPFSWELLKKTCPSLIVDTSSESVAKEDHLVIVVIRGGTA